MKKIIIEVSPTGEVKMEAKGFKGRSCLKASEPFRKALGIPDSAVVATRDMWKMEEAVDEKVTAKNGN